MGGRGHKRLQAWVVSQTVEHFAALFVNGQPPVCGKPGWLEPPLLFRQRPKLNESADYSQIVMVRLVRATCCGSVPL